MHAAPVDGKAPDLLVMVAAAHLQHHEAAMQDIGFLDVAQQDDGIGQRRDMLLAGAMAADQRLVRGGAQAGDLALLDEGGQADQELAKAGFRCDPLQSRKAVDGKPLR